MIHATHRPMQRQGVAVSLPPAGACPVVRTYKGGRKYKRGRGGARGSGFLGSVSS